MGDPATQLPLLEELKAAGYVRYIGVTTTFEGQYRELVQLMRNEPIDFIGIDYAVDSRSAEEVVLPLALERKIGVLAYMPFGRGRMWTRIGDRPVPDWATEFDAYSWAQLMLKFVVAHPAVTVRCPGTSDSSHMADNLGGGRGRLSDADQVERIVRVVEGTAAGLTGSLARRSRSLARSDFPGRSHGYRTPEAASLAVVTCPRHERPTQPLPESRLVRPGAPPYLAFGTLRAFRLTPPPSDESPV